MNLFKAMARTRGSINGRDKRGKEIPSMSNRWIRCWGATLLLLVCPRPAFCEYAPDVEPKVAGNDRIDLPALLGEVETMALRDDGTDAYARQVALEHLVRAYMRLGDHRHARQLIGRFAKAPVRERYEFELAVALAGAGEWREARKVCPVGDDEITLAYIRHLLSNKGDANVAELINSLSGMRMRPALFAMLSVAQATDGRTEKAKQSFALATETADKVAGELGRVETLGEVADVLIAHQDIDNARTVIARIMRIAVAAEAEQERISGFGEAGYRFAKVGDRSAAKEAFSHAVQSRVKMAGLTLEEKRRDAETLTSICRYQAAAGFVDDALTTARTIRPFRDGSTGDICREKSICEVCRAQARGGHFDEAITTANTLSPKSRARCEVLMEIAELQLRQKALDNALETTAEIPNSVRKGILVLRIAAALAESGDKAAAEKIARDLQVTDASPESRLAVEFHVDNPRTWGNPYYLSLFLPRRSAMVAMEDAAELAAAAMTLAQLLQRTYAESFDELFDDRCPPSIVYALARAHAAHGNSRAALSWVRHYIAKPAVNDDDPVPLERILVLIGIAEGVMDRDAVSEVRVSR